MAAKSFTELLKDAPKNWGRWGGNDEIGALNFLTNAEVLRGVIFNEIDWLYDLAEDCAKDGQYTFLFVGAPLKVVGGAGSPVNPTVIK